VRIEARDECSLQGKAKPKANLLRKEKQKLKIYVDTTSRLIEALVAFGDTVFLKTLKRLASCLLIKAIVYC
jgi:hypothetical protein